MEIEIVAVPIEHPWPASIPTILSFLAQRRGLLLLPEIRGLDAEAKTTGDVDATMVRLEIVTERDRGMSVASAGLLTDPDCCGCGCVSGNAADDVRDNNVASRCLLGSGRDEEHGVVQAFPNASSPGSSRVSGVDRLDWTVTCPDATVTSSRGCALWCSSSRGCETADLALRFVSDGDGASGGWVFSGAVSVNVGTSA